MRSWWTVAGIFVALGLIAGYRLIADAGSLLDWLVLVLVVAAGAAAIVHHNAVATLEAERRSEAESFARILSGLSRSVSPDAVVDAIVKELAAATIADHVVVARRRPGARVLDATLVSSRPGLRDSSIILPISDLEERIDRVAVAVPVQAEAAVAVGGSGVVTPTKAVLPDDAGGEPNIDDWEPDHSGDPGQQVADRIATRVRRAYGLRNTIAAPLVPGAVMSGFSAKSPTRGPRPPAACSTAPHARRPRRSLARTPTATRKPVPRSTR